MLNKVIKTNWKYILTELVLIFVGIYLALSLNNWNETKKVNREKASVVQKLEEEVAKNLQMLKGAEAQNLPFFRAFERFGQLLGDDNREIEATEEEYQEFVKDYPDFFTLHSKRAIGGSKFKYKLNLKIKFDNTRLRDIAWSTAKTAGFSREFSYACLLEIEDVYREQDRYMREIGKILPYVLASDYSELPVTAILARQYQAGLQESYQKLLQDIKNCQ